MSALVEAGLAQQLKKGLVKSARARVKRPPPTDEAPAASSAPRLHTKMRLEFALAEGEAAASRALELLAALHVARRAHAASVDLSALREAAQAVLEGEGASELTAQLPLKPVPLKPEVGRFGLAELERFGEALESWLATSGFDGRYSESAYADDYAALAWTAAQPVGEASFREVLAIGEGGYGRVTMAWSKVSGCPFAVKRMEKAKVKQAKHGRLQLWKVRRTA